MILSAYPKTLEEKAAVQHAIEYLRENEWRPLISELRIYGFPHELELQINSMYLATRAMPASADAAHPLGMDYYHKADAAILGGRGPDVMRLEQLVQTHSCSALVGPSGAGKSSVLHAGLVPSLEVLKDWRTVISRPDRETGRFFTPDSFAEILDRTTASDESFEQLLRRVLAHVWANVGYSGPVRGLDVFWFIQSPSCGRRDASRDGPLP